MGAGARLEVVEESDGLKLRVLRAVAHTDVSGLAGMIKLPAQGKRRNLSEFDAASLLSKSAARSR